MKIKVNGTVLHYEVAGNGETIVMIHGACHNAMSWQWQIADFSRQYRVLTYDVRGHGQSELGDAEGSQDLWAKDLSLLLTGLGIQQVYVIGHSMGGGIAATFAIKEPKRVKALVLSNAYGIGLSTEAARQQLRDMQKTDLEKLEKEGMDGLVKARLAGPSFSPGFVEKNAFFRQWYQEMMLRTSAESYKRVIPVLIKRTPPEFSRITCPTLIIVGDYDGNRGPDAGKQVQAMIPGSELKSFPTGHNPFFEKPQEFNSTVLDFLRRVRNKQRAN